MEGTLCMSVTVIIPTYRPDRRFGLLLEALARQTVKPERILIINTEEALFDPALAEGIPGITVRHITKAQFDHGGTRDQAANMADTPLLMFMTMDAVPADEYLIENLCRAFMDRQVACAYARQLPAEDCDELERQTRLFSYPPESRKKTEEDLKSLGIRTFFCSNVCAMYRADVYRQLGGFEKHSIFNEDMVFAAKAVMAGFAVYYEAAARVIHSHNYSGAVQFHRNFDIGVSQAQHPEIFNLAASESAGASMILRSAGHFIRTGKPHLLFRLVWISACKYAGYRLGKRYRKLPRRLILRCTWNKEYWKKQEK